MNKFKNLFRHKSTRKDEDELDKFVRGKENERPKSKKVDPLDRTATACYHTEVAPKTKRGPKSCPGGMSDDLGGGHVNRSFETEIPQRRRNRSPPEFRESTRHKRSNMAFSEYGAPSTKMSNITYHREVVEECMDDEEVDVNYLKVQVKELGRKLYFANARKHYYKSEFNDLKDEQRRINKAYKAQEEKYQREIEQKDATIKALRENQPRCQCQRNTMIYQNTLNQHTFNHHMMFNNSFAPAPSNATPVVSDPQPTRTDLFPMSANFSHFDSGEKDEMKVFRHRDSTSTFPEDMDY